MEVNSLKHARREPVHLRNGSVMMKNELLSLKSYAALLVARAIAAFLTFAVALAGLIVTMANKVSQIDQEAGMLSTLLLSVTAGFEFIYFVIALVLYCR